MVARHDEQAPGRSPGLTGLFALSSVTPTGRDRNH